MPSEGAKAAARPSRVSRSVSPWLSAASESQNADASSPVDVGASSINTREITNLRPSSSDLGSSPGEFRSRNPAAREVPSFGGSVLCLYRRDLERNVGLEPTRSLDSATC